MRITIKKKNMKRLASLSALGAGALAVAVPNAQASIIHDISGTTVGFSGGASPLATFGLTGIAQFQMHTGASSGTFHVAMQVASGYFKMRTVPGPVLAAFPSGSSWGAAPANFLLGVVAKHTFSGSNRTPFGAVNKYFLFEFKDSTSGNAMRYGWGQLTVSFTANKPDVTLVDYAYDTTGVKLAAGNLGGTVPEPSGLALSGLGALVLGAAGIRRWRAARQS